MKLTYKIVAAALAIITIAIIVFTPLIHIGIESVALQGLVFFGQAIGNDYAKDLVGEDGNLPQRVNIDLSIADIFGDDASATAELVKGLSGEKDANALEKLEILFAPAIVFAIALLLVVICAIVVAVLAFATKDNRKVIGASVTGVGLSLLVAESFEAIAAPFLSSDITLASIAGNSWISLIGDIDAVEFSSTFWAVPIIFAAIILWTVLYNYTLPADEKKRRLEMIGEAEEK